MKLERTIIIMDSEKSEPYLDLYERYSQSGLKSEDIYGQERSNLKGKNNNNNSNIGSNNSNSNNSIQPSNNNSQLHLNNNVQIADNINVLPPNDSNQIANEIGFQIFNNNIGQSSNVQLSNNNLKAQSPSIDYSINSINLYIKGGGKLYYIINIFFKLL